MAGKKNLMLTVLLTAGFLLACNFGRVNQGRVVSYDAGKGVVTLIPETPPSKPGGARYVLPPATVRIPQDRKEMGAAPRAGKLLLVDAADQSVLVFDDVSGSLRRIPVVNLQQQHGVLESDPRVANVTFPVIDANNRAITVYSVSDRKLHTFRVAAEDLALPSDTWKMGDDVRYYYRQPEQALRLMNVTRTDLRKGGH
jgi:hypothetical protein